MGLRPGSTAWRTSKSAAITLLPKGEMDPSVTKNLGLSISDALGQ